MDGLVVGYLATLYQLNPLFSIESNERMMTFSDTERIGEGTVVDYFEVVHRHLPGESEGNQDKFQRGSSVFQPKFEPGNSRI
jgi:hypothetical protein